MTKAGTLSGGEAGRQRPPVRLWRRSSPPGDGKGRWALLSGLLAFLAFPPAGLAPLALVALVPLMRVVFDREVRSPFRAFRLGWLGAAGFFVLLLHWLLLLANDEVTIPGIMLPALFVVAAYLGLYFGLAAGLAHWLGRRTRVPGELWLCVTWLLVDWLRSSGEIGFPWGGLGYAFARMPMVIQIAAWTGVWGITFWILCVNALVTLAWRYGGERRWGAAAAGLVLLPPIFGALVLQGAEDSVRAVAPPAERSGAAAIAEDEIVATLVQANTPREIKWKVGYRKTVIDDLLEKTRQAAREHDPDLVVWPETAAPIRIPWEKELARSVQETVAEVGRWVLVGTLDAKVLGPEEYEDYNAALLFTPAAEVRQRYYKRHLVPFGEITPFKRILPILARLDFGQSEFTPGREATIFVGPKGARFRVLICFESIFPELAREGVRDGAGVLVNITNDFWFGRSAGPLQHGDMAVLRAVENRVPMLRCANSGLSFFVDPYGRVSSVTPLFTAGLPTAAVRPRGGGSPYTRHGDVGPWILGGVFVLGVVLALAKPAAPGRADVAG